LTQRSYLIRAIPREEKARSRGTIPSNRSVGEEKRFLFLLGWQVKKKWWPPTDASAPAGQWGWGKSKMM
jgi:hypothetical protein